MKINIELPCSIGDNIFTVIDGVDVPYVKEDKIIAFELWNKNGQMTLFVRTIYGTFECGEKAFINIHEAISKI